MPFMSGTQLATHLRSIRNVVFNIILVSADELENDDKLFDFVIEKPIPMKKMEEFY